MPMSVTIEKSYTPYNGGNKLWGKRHSRINSPYTLMLYFCAPQHQVRVLEQIAIVSRDVSSVIVLFLFVSVSALQRKPYVMLIQLAILNCQLIHFTSESFPIQSNEELAGLNRKIHSVLYRMNIWG